MDYKSSLEGWQDGRKGNRKLDREDEETGIKGCIHTSRDAENPQ